MSDIWGYYEPLQKVICRDCKHYNREKPFTCKAFPDEIPRGIIIGKIDHSKPLPNQGNNIVFEPKES
jgi:hypothetical protein